jgi:hypothetical protein
MVLNFTQECAQAYAFGKEPRYTMILNQLEDIVARSNSFLVILSGCPREEIEATAAGYLGSELSQVITKIQILSFSLYPTSSRFSTLQEWVTDLYRSAGEGYLPDPLLATSDADTLCNQATIQTMHCILCLQSRLRSLQVVKDSEESYHINYIDPMASNFSFVEQFFIGFPASCNSSSMKYQVNVPTFTEYDYLTLANVIELDQYREVLKICMTEYKNFLGSLASGGSLAQTIPPYKFASDTDITKDLRELSIKLEGLEEITKQFYMDYISKLESANQVSSISEEMSNKIEEMVSKLNQRIIVPLQTAIGQMIDIFTNFYYEFILENAVYTARYLPQHELSMSKRIENLALWKKPLPDLYSDDVIRFDPKASPISISYDHGLERFYDGSANSLIKHAVGEFFDELLDAISEMSRNFDSKIDSIRVLREDTSYIIEEIEEENEIGTEFVKFVLVLLRF